MKLATPDMVVVALLLVGSGCATAGVYLLAGPAWSLICVAGLAFVVVFLVLRGLNGGEPNG